MDQLVIQLEEEKLLRVNLQLLNTALENKIHQLAVDNAKQDELLVAKNFQQDEEINQLKNKVKILDVADSTQQKAPLNGKDGTMINTSANDLII